MDINIGDLDKRIKIISLEDEKDESGFSTQNKKEKTIVETWSQVTNTSGTQLIKNNVTFSSVSTRFLIRTPKTELNINMFIVFRNKKYDIKYINDYEHNREFSEIFAEVIE